MPITKEQYEETKDYLLNDSDMEPPLVWSYCKDMFELIETMRNVVEAADTIIHVTRVGRDIAEQQKAFSETVEALRLVPRWMRPWRSIHD